MRPRRSRGTLPERKDSVRGACAPRCPERRVPDAPERTALSKCYTASSPWDGAGAGVVSEVAVGCRPCETRTRSLHSTSQRILPGTGELGLTSAVGGDMYGSQTINLLA